ncbi:Lipoprotein-releasing system ATP-binding protein LolD [Waddlia chondrophila 2032/99]|uniref:Lipoprotein-releasing system ATP-binding protein LolD n=1 Tax=Waddlia chondrophila 2032/99 TaxID=765953 RepID=F8LCZ4_9BACT|nr:Lipoprotein-releasing system ATP-binding protein LolD [Waddlia chondrophila 2032/99]
MILKAKNIHKSFTHPIRTQILKGIDLEVERGETVSIMGRSGEGKSTLLHILGTLEKACQGQLEIAGFDAAASNQTAIRSKHIGFVFQSFHLLEDCTTLENVLMPARIARRSTSPKSEAFLYAEHLLEKVGLGERMFHNVKLLSGGEKQRAAIARALCNDPDLIFADEPSGNLDQRNAELIYEILFSFVSDKKKSLITVTHDDTLAKMCRTQYQLQNGLLEKQT